MRKFYVVVLLVVGLALVLSACGPQAAPVTYKTVSVGTLKAGSAVPAPSGPVILTIDGSISQKNAGDKLEFDMATLESIGLIQYKVNDTAEKRSIMYTGVLLSELLKVIGADPKATTLSLWALDDYSADMKIADATKWPIMIATQADGAYMPLDKKGPLFSIIPFDDYPEIDHLTYDNLAVWALAKITVK